jgi:DNA helicase HerA-like ATPase
MGVLIEEIFEKVQLGTIIVIADPMGIFHTMALSNEDQIPELYQWGLTERSFPVRLLVPGDPVYRYGSNELVDILRERGVDIQSLRINPMDLSPDAWCTLFNLNINDLMGISLYRSVSNLQDKGDFFSIGDLEQSIRKDPKAQDKTKEALLNRLDIASKWGIFEDGDRDAKEEKFTSGVINILDLSVVDPGSHGLRNLIVDIVARRLFSMRTKARRKEEFGLSSDMPRVWLAMDEAHQFVPQSGSSLCKEIIIRWVKEGRQPGLGLIAATQQPSAIDSELLSQCDLILSHKITTVDDIQSLNRLSATYMSGELRSFVRNLSQRGEAILVDDERENVSRITIRPRRSKHGGGEPTEQKIRGTFF